MPVGLRNILTFLAWVMQSEYTQLLPTIALYRLFSILEAARKGYLNIRTNPHLINNEMPLRYRIVSELNYQRSLKWVLLFP
jgi:hypothetical protein